MKFTSSLEKGKKGDGAQAAERAPLAVKYNNGFEAKEIEK